MPRVRTRRGRRGRRARGGEFDVAGTRAETALTDATRRDHVRTASEHPARAAVTLPPPLRNRLAALILDAFHDPEARRGLEAAAFIGTVGEGLGEAPGPPEGFPRDGLLEHAEDVRMKGAWRQHAAELRARAGRAWRALDGRPLDSREPPLAAALSAAGLLFDAGLYFEAHERLEPYWSRSTGGDREALQGLIQVAVGFQHLANGNVAGARALLRDGSARLIAREIATLALDPFGRAIVGCLDDVLRLGTEGASRFDWTTVPRFPSRTT